MKLQVFHETSYRYEHPVRRSIQMLRMTPAKTQRQNVLNWQLDLPGKATQWTDAYGNLCHCLVLENASQDIVLRARGTQCPGWRSDVCSSDHIMQSHIGARLNCGPKWFYKVLHLSVHAG